MISWHCKYWNEISIDDFHDLLQVRINVFVVEQNCPYPELDNKDKKSIHVFGKNKSGDIIAVARIVPPGISYKEVSIGRVVTNNSDRQTGLGIQLMNFAIEKIEEKFGKTPIRISAQEYLKAFYEKFGFKKVSESYLEDNIPHIEMLRD